MARRISPSQLRSMIRQAEAKQRRAISEYNRAVREYKRKVNRAVDDYNRAARAHNAKVQSSRRRLQTELARLKSGGSTRPSSIRTSTKTLYRSYTLVEARVEASGLTPRESRFLDLSGREAANSVAVVNALDGRADEATAEDLNRLTDTAVGDELRVVSAELDQRWRGALFALDPRNPDAARHFCTSAREVFTSFLERHAPDDEVLAVFPACDRTRDGRPTRRTRVRLLMSRQAMDVTEYENFVADDVENILELFQVLNDGTHGSAGKYSIAQLSAVKRRVEDGILFLASLVG